jgi:hypothetical protein
MWRVCGRNSSAYEAGNSLTTGATNDCKNFLRMNATQLLEHVDRLAEAPDAVLHVH